MQFIGKITECRPVQGTSKRGENYHGVDVTVVESNVPEGVYANCGVVYIPDAAPEQFPVGALIDIEVRLDIQIYNNRKYTRVYTHYIKPEVIKRAAESRGIVS